ncbi:hypothetical protein Tco_0673527 [Tanacetum coccineum]
MCRWPSLTMRNRDAPRRIVPVENPANALVVQDGIGGYDWSFQAEEGLTNFALMACTSQGSSSSDSKYCERYMKNNGKSVAEEDESGEEDISDGQYTSTNMVVLERACDFFFHHAANLSGILLRMVERKPSQLKNQLEDLGDQLFNGACTFSPHQLKNKDHKNKEHKQKWKVGNCYEFFRNTRSVGGFQSLLLL